MDVLFVNNLNFSQTSVAGDLNIGIMNLATILKESHFSVDLFLLANSIEQGLISLEDDYQSFSYRLVDLILDYNAKVIGFTSMYDTYVFVIDLAEKIKRRDKDVKIVLGGPQPSITAEETMSAFDFIDMIAIGETESTIVQIIDGLLNADANSSRSLWDIPNIVFRQGDQWHVTRREPLCMDLALLPQIDDYFLSKFINKVEMYYVDVGRGCPYSCTFCCTNDFWHRKFRLKPTENILKEIRYVHEKYGIKVFSFQHDLFTANKEKLLSFCDALRNSGLDISWGCSSRADALDDEVIEAMARAHCRNVYLGIETGSDRMQREIKKNLRLNEVIPKIKALHRSKIKVTCSFIYGLADEKVSDYKETLSLITDIIALNTSTIQLHRWFPIVKTEEFGKISDKLYLDAGRINCQLSEGRYLENCISIIDSHKVLFGNFYEFDSEVRRMNINKMDVFITVLLTMHKFYKYIYDTLLSKYHNILDAYYHYLDLLYGELDGIDIGDVELNIRKEFSNKLNKIIAQITEDLTSVDNMRLIRASYEFGKDIYDFDADKKCAEEFKDYPFNVILLYKNGRSMSHADAEENIRVRFSKDNYGDLNFQRVL